MFTTILSVTINYNMYMCTVYTIYDLDVSGMITPNPNLIIRSLLTGISLFIYVF